MRYSVLLIYVFKLMLNKGKMICPQITDISAVIAKPYAGDTISYR